MAEAIGVSKAKAEEQESLVRAAVEKLPAKVLDEDDKVEAEGDEDDELDGNKVEVEADEDEELDGEVVHMIAGTIACIRQPDGRCGCSVVRSFGAVAILI